MKDVNVFILFLIFFVKYVKLYLAKIGTIYTEYFFQNQNWLPSPIWLLVALIGNRPITQTLKSNWKCLKYSENKPTDLIVLVPPSLVFFIVWKLFKCHLNCSNIGFSLRWRLGMSFGGFPWLQKVSRNFKS